MPFDYQPTLTSDLIALRPLHAGDFNALYRVARDPLIWEQHPVPNRYEMAEFKKFFDESLASGGALVAVDRASNRVVGSSRYHGYDAIRNEIEIGWSFLARSHWGGTYNGEMKRLMLEHAFRFVNVVVLLISPDNIRSQRAAEKIGAVRAGTRPHPIGVEALVFEIFSMEWSRTNAN
ncbi:MAG: GNAT family N-acetyltransferase [Phycisphaerales bacterium]|nr:GNAT family N-acetyltransferase [Phycisphaerales bacterium]